MKEAMPIHHPTPLSTARAKGDGAHSRYAGTPAAV